MLFAVTINSRNMGTSKGGNGNSQTIPLGGISASSVSAYYMDNSVSSLATFSATNNGGTVEGNLPAYSVVTFVNQMGSVPPASTTTTTTSTSPSSTSFQTPQFHELHTAPRKKPMNANHHCYKLGPGLR